MSKHKVVVRNTFTSPKPRDGPGDMKLSKSETFNDLQDWVSGGQAHPRPSQQTIYSLTRRSLPLVPHWLSTMDAQSFPRSPKFHYFSLPNLHPHFSTKAFLLVYHFLQHAVCLGNLQVHELCLSCKSLGKFRTRAQAVAGVLSI